ncbi:unnamed protein product [Caenorhabditis auriculariae]|uniref:Phospholipid scramblase n=1 Tax=Caenorhabditis auriculariae TaxID=2777116 RepID=A0A8S1HTG7_9PELO|nr:unnamed protein product [Caenorhabditis auriculariae]
MNESEGSNSSYNNVQPMLPFDFHGLEILSNITLLNISKENQITDDKNEESPRFAYIVKDPQDRMILQVVDNAENETKGQGLPFSLSIFDSKRKQIATLDRVIKPQWRAPCYGPSDQLFVYHPPKALSGVITSSPEFWCSPARRISVRADHGDVILTARYCDAVSRFEVTDPRHNFVGEIHRKVSTLGKYPFTTQTTFGCSFLQGLGVATKLNMLALAFYIEFEWFHHVQDTTPVEVERGLWFTRSPPYASKQPKPFFVGLHEVSFVGCAAVASRFLVYLRKSEIDRRRLKRRQRN